MIDGKTVLAIIPARGGSKRVPRKNLREYRGKSLLQWAIEQGKSSKYIDLLVVSTDDKEIALAALNMNCTMISRPPEFATDTSSSEDVMRCVLQSVTSPYDWIVLLQPTSPNRTVEDIDGCIERAQMGYGCISYTRGALRDYKNGAVYVATAQWLAEHDFTYGGLMKYEMPEERSLDIDNPEDFLK